MVIMNAPLISEQETILRYIPAGIRRYLYGEDLSGVEEIRLRLGQPVMLKGGGSLSRLTRGNHEVRATRKDMEEGLELATASSVYAAEEEIKNGYITVEGGSRIGICGRCVVKGGEVSFIKNISGFNYRLAREIKTSAEEVYPEVISHGRVLNTLILSPPGCGKTTMLRDLARRISNSGRTVCIVDERSELAGMTGGIASFDIGVNTDVLDGAPKAVGMLMALRSMSPEVIVTDEMGAKADIEAAAETTRCGISLVASLHAANREEAWHKKASAELMGCFECIVTLSASNGVGTVEEVWKKCAVSSEGY